MCVVANKKEIAPLHWEKAVNDVQECRICMFLLNSKTRIILIITGY